MAEEKKKPLPIIEIVTGIIIVAIIIVYGVPRYMGGQERDAVEDDASNLFYNLMKAKNRAMETKIPAFVVFEGNQSYTLFLDSNNNEVPDEGEVMNTGKLSPNVEFGINSNPPTPNVWGTGNVLKGIDLDDGSTQLYFNADGKADPGGALYFIHKADVGVTNNNVYAVRILGATGEIRVLKPAPGETPPWK